MMMKTIIRKILIIEDEPSITDCLNIYCKAEGYRVMEANTGSQGLQKFLTERPDLVLLDLTLPELNGFEVCRRIRKVSEVPIVMLTGRTEEVDKLIGFELGADDYVTKPFSPREVMARIRGIFRRLDKATAIVEDIRPTVDVRSPSYVAATSEERVLAVGRLEINSDTREVFYDRQIVPLLTNKEYELLLTLARRPGRIYTKNELEESLYGCDGGLLSSRAVGVHISNLRSKLPNPRLIENVHGVGYKLDREQL